MTGRPDQQEGDGPADAPETSGLEERRPTELDDVRKTLEDTEQRHLRLLAEFDNFRRRTAREQAAAADSGRRAALLPLLDVLDALDQALASGSSDDTFYQGVAATRRLFADALQDAGAEPIATLGERFDPTVHEAVETVSDDAGADAAPGTIVRETRSGWRLGDRLLRPAQVVVTNAD
jgi:molecular chaperone GrpE